MLVRFRRIGSISQHRNQRCVPIPADAGRTSRSRPIGAHLRGAEPTLSKDATRVCRWASPARHIDQTSGSTGGLHLGRSCAEITTDYHVPQHRVVIKINASAQTATFKRAHAMSRRASSPTHRPERLPSSKCASKRLRTDSEAESGAGTASDGDPPRNPEADGIPRLKDCFHEADRPEPQAAQGPL